MNNDNLGLNTIDMEQDKATDKVIAIRNLVRKLELRFKGYETDSDGQKFYPTGKVLLGEELVRKAIGLLQPFSEEALLIGVKEVRVIARQKFQVNMAFNDACLLDMGCPENNYKVVFQMFKQTLQNISDIIFSSRSYMEKLYGQPEITEKIEERPLNIG